jgi:hypothetical protein
LHSPGLERRDLTKGQKAMLLAVRFPETQQGKKRTSIVSVEVSQQSISYARAVNRFCPEMVPQIIEGACSLDDAYNEAQRRKAAQHTNESRFNVLRCRFRLLSKKPLAKAEWCTNTSEGSRGRLSAPHAAWRGMFEGGVAC